MFRIVETDDIFGIVQGLTKLAAFQPLMSCNIMMEFFENMLCSRPQIIASLRYSRFAYVPVKLTIYSIAGPSRHLNDEKKFSDCSRDLAARRLREKFQIFRAFFDVFEYL